jgi:hypothetical protein
MTFTEPMNADNPPLNHTQACNGIELMGFSTAC